MSSDSLASPQESSPHLTSPHLTSSFTVPDHFIQCLFAFCVFLFYVFLFSSLTLHVRAQFVLTKTHSVTSLSHITQSVFFFSVVHFCLIFLFLLFPPLGLTRSCPLVSGFFCCRYQYSKIRVLIIALRSEPCVFLASRLYWGQHFLSSQHNIFL